MIGALRGSDFLLPLPEGGRREFQEHIDNCYRVLDEWNESNSGGDVPTPEEMKRGLNKYRREIKHFI